jgi:membrane-bound lytic murein transglycosylase B|tara:strand:- start:407 stop:1402 length:996 start_codon:yes stop_codon:yes gene_type:complete
LLLRKTKNILGCVLTTAVIGGASSTLADYTENSKAQALMDKMVAEYNYDRGELEKIFTSANRDNRILDSMNNAAEKVKPWSEYRPHFITDLRVRQGIAFMQKHSEALAQADQEYGVPPAVITAIIGVETNYGSYTGKASVLNSLSTLAFEHPRRSSYFTSELENYLLLVRERDWQADKQLGSYAGAMGLAQFMPSNYRTLAVDFDGDGITDLFNPVDAIGSVANYFKHHGWISGGSVAAPAVVIEGYDKEEANRSLRPSKTIAELAELGYISTVAYEPAEKAIAMSFSGISGDEYWIGLTNFYVISRYNPRQKYAMAIYHLSQEIKAAENG